MRSLRNLAKESKPSRDHPVSSHCGRHWLQAVYEILRLIEVDEPGEEDLATRM
jgi:hypothetical protein